MIDLEYYLLNPNENVTVLVTSPVEEKKRAAASKLLFQREKNAEQVGFVSFDKENKAATVCMSGGEFCGNAAMAASALFAEMSSLGKVSVLVSFLKTGENVTVFAEKTSGSDYQCCSEMPAPTDIKDITLELDGDVFSFTCVEYSGISHIICEEQMQKKTAQKAVKKWCSDMDVKALGIMFLDTEKRNLVPLVYVKESATLYWEGSCASGTAAAGEYMNYKYGTEKEFCFCEPKAKMKTLKKSGENLILFGTVSMQAHKFTECEV